MTDDALVQLVTRVVHGDIAEADIPWAVIDPGQLSTFRFLMRHETARLRRLRHRASPAQRRALTLLRGLLTPSQCATLRRHRYVEVATPQHLYRIYPSKGITRRVVRRKTKTFAVIRYCYHDPDAHLPPADVALAHFLWLHADEGAFLHSANAHLTRTFHA